MYISEVQLLFQMGGIWPQVFFFLFPDITSIFEILDLTAAALFFFLSTKKNIYKVVGNTLHYIYIYIYIFFLLPRTFKIDSDGGTLPYIYPEGCRPRWGAPAPTPTTLPRARVNVMNISNNVYIISVNVI